ncbi:MAG: hypothetical protein EXR31_06055 [Betaproteobacteria bacterium]|nr:hypothetical protein [Betaproteobacteria bacterium]
MSLRTLAAALLLAPAFAGAAGVQDALRAGELICEFKAGYKRSVIADMLGDVQPIEQMLVYEAVGRDTANVVSTRAPGRMPVEVRATAKAVHFIERKGPSLLVTTLTRCERSAMKKGEEICVRFAARHAWHFDLLALKEPDASLERQPSGALRGVCEPWQLD